MSPQLTDRRRALLERLFVAFNRHDIDGIMGCFAPDIVFEAAAGPDACGRRYVGHREVRAAFIAVWTDLRNPAWHVRAHTITGDRGFSEWCFTATRPDGGRIEVDGIDLFTFTDELIASKSALRKERPVQSALAGACA